MPESGGPKVDKLVLMSPAWEVEAGYNHSGRTLDDCKPQRLRLRSAVVGNSM